MESLTSGAWSLGRESSLFDVVMQIDVAVRTIEEIALLYFDSETA